MSMVAKHPPRQQDDGSKASAQTQRWQKHIRPEATNNGDKVSALEERWQSIC
jgi:hypothetical protein